MFWFTKKQPVETEEVKEEKKIPCFVYKWVKIYNDSAFRLYAKIIFENEKWGGFVDIEGDNPICIKTMIDMMTSDMEATLKFRQEEC